jgi:hypothetical protein
MPGEGFTHGPPANKECRRQVPQVKPNHPAFPARWAFRLLRALPGNRACLPPTSARCPRHRRELDTSIGVSGPHDLTVCTLPFVHALARAATDCSHRLPTSRLVTTANRPSSSRRDGRKCAGDLPDGASPVAAANQHDGQFAHEGDAGIARRADARPNDIGAVVVSQLITPTTLTGRHCVAHLFRSDPDVKLRTGLLRYASLPRGRSNR